MSHSGSTPLTTAAQEVIPQLQDAAVACILQHVPLQQRLSVCAMVCRAWAAAAVTVTTNIDILFKRSNRCVHLQDWLAKRGGVVVALTAQHSPCAQSISTHPLRLPVLQLMQLRSLNLSRVKAQLSAQGSSACSSTRSLRSSGGLTHTRASSSSSAGSAAAAAAIGLPQLQELALCDCDLNLQLMSQLLSATTLTKLRWDGMQLVSRRGTQRPLAPVFSMLGKLTGLQELHLREPVYPYPSAEQGAQELLTALQHLTQLRHLDLYRCLLCSARPQQQGGGGYQCFSALTASTHLTALKISEWNLVTSEWDGVPVPQAAFNHMFPAGHVLPHLKQLTLQGAIGCRQHCVELAQLSRVAASCPALQNVSLFWVTPAGFGSDSKCSLQLPPCQIDVRGSCGP